MTLKNKVPYLLIALLCLVYACETDEETPSAQEDVSTDITPSTPIDPTLISEYHIISNTGDVSSIYSFDDQGNLSKYRELSEDFETHFRLNTDLQITQIVTKDLSGNEIEVLQNIVYDANGNIAQINDRTFFYNPIENAYYENSDVMQDGVLLNTTSDTNYNKYYYEEGNPLLQFCYMITEVEGDIFNEYCYEDSGWTTGVYEGNITSIFPHYYRYYYDDLTNPLYSTTNLKDLMAFIPELRQEAHRLTVFFSENNHIKTDEPGGPPDEWFSTYDFNAYALPTNEYSSYFYAGEQQGETRLSARYYYQE